MPKVVGIKFRKAPKVYNFEAGEFEYQIGQGVIVETSKGVEYGTVAVLPVEISQDEVVAPLKPIERLSTKADDDKIKKFDSRHDETMRKCSEMIEKSGLDMKLVDVEFTFDETKLIVHFTSDGRVDFRDLVRSLASMFRLRIELRQIGSRDECRMIGGLGSCGRVCCCNSYLNDFTHVSIKMAKNQGLSLNPAKISGLCGRLMCCLEYENDHYAETNKKMPKLGAYVQIADGLRGYVVNIMHLKNKVRIKSMENDVLTFSDHEPEELTVLPKPNNNQPSAQKVESKQGGEEKAEKQDKKSSKPDKNKQKPKDRKEQPKKEQQKNEQPQKEQSQVGSGEVKDVATEEKPNKPNKKRNRNRKKKNKAQNGEGAASENIQNENGAAVTEKAQNTTPKSNNDGVVKLKEPKPQGQQD